MQYEVVNFQNNEWAAEAVDEKSGDCYRVLFMGPNAETQAREYAAWATQTAKEESHG